MIALVDHRIVEQVDLMMGSVYGNWSEIVHIQDLREVPADLV